MAYEREYRVTWEIDVSADTPADALERALSVLAPAEPGRWSYTVTDNETGESAHLGLEAAGDESEGEGETPSEPSWRESGALAQDRVITGGGGS